MQGTPDLPIAKAWGEWLGRYEWSHWATLTFRDHRPGERAGLGPALSEFVGVKRGPKLYAGPSPEFARRAFDGWVAQLSTPYRGEVPYFRGDELGPRTGRLHLHALVGLREDVPPAALKRAWRLGWSAIERYDPELGAAHYVAKYVAKDFRDYDISARLPRLAPRTS